MYHCIKKSLSHEAERKIFAEQESYKINKIPSVPLLFFKANKDIKQDNKCAWKKKAPKAGKPWTKKVNDKTYNWCK